MPISSGHSPSGTGRDAWMEQVARVLTRGRPDASPADLERRFAQVLTTPTYDGITLQPLYTAGDAPPSGVEGLPGSPPFTRGTAPARPSAGWDVRQIVIVTGGVRDRPDARAVRELESGAVSVMLELRRAEVIDADLLGGVLQGVHLDAAPVALDAGARWSEAAGALRDLWRRSGLTPAPGGSLGADPIGEYASSGGAVGEPGRDLAALATLAAEVAGQAPGVRTIAVDGHRYHAAGASRAQEIGAALATAVAYLRALTAAGLSVDEAARQIEFRLAADAQQFHTIAALRALRRLWDRVGDVCAVTAPARAARIHAIGARAMLTRNDPWVNLLRGTIAAFAAGVGGADIVTLAPHDALSGPPGGPLGARMARNTQALLIDESGVGRVLDPAGGSYYVERLTAELATAGWEAFQHIERAGGILDALRSGELQREVGATWERRREAIAQRRDPITGVSEFPNIDEPIGAPPPELDTPDPDATPFAPLGRHRYAEDFEALRARAERAAAAGSAPLVFLATLGAAADHTARATFAKNLFEAGGIRASSPGDLGPDDDIGAALRACGARLACICSSDALYAERAAGAASALREAGAQRIYLAGRPGDDADVLRAAGVDEFVGLGADAVEVLGRAHALLGVPG